MKKTLFLLYLIPILLFGCTYTKPTSITIITAREIALEAYPNYDIISVVKNSYAFEPYYIITLTNGENLYVIKISINTGAIIDINHQSIDSNSI